jgi:hypothetical protein
VLVGGGEGISGSRCARAGLAAVGLDLLRSSPPLQVDVAVGMACFAPRLGVTSLSLFGQSSRFDRLFARCVCSDASGSVETGPPACQSLKE